MTKTRQEIFDIAYKGLASQEFAQSVNPEDDTCQYDDGNGHHCAIGWVLAHDGVDPTPFESLGIHYAKQHWELSAMIIEALNVPIEESPFLCRLQQCHDLHENPYDMKHALKEFAKKHDLSVPHVE